MYVPPRKKGPRRNDPVFEGKMRFKVGDTVRVLSGKDKGKEGQITRVLPAVGKVVVEGVNIVIKHQKARPQMGGGMTESGRIEQAMPLYACKVALVDPADSAKTTRLGVKTNAEGVRVRFARKSGSVID